MAIRQRNSAVRLFGRRLLILGLFVLILAIAWGDWGAYKKERESRLLRAEAERQLHDIAQRQTQLSNDIQSLQTSRGMEEVLREQYALGAPGEDLIVIVEQPSVESAPATTTMFETLKKAFFWW